MSEFLESINTALDGAKYHENQAFVFAYATVEKDKKESYRQVVYHLRAYFWELWSVWDYILQSANARTLNLPRVDTRLVDQLEKKMPDYKHLPSLQAIRDSGWLKRLARLRHAAHRWILNPNLVEYSGSAVTVIAVNMQDGQSPAQINIDRNDLLFMTQSATNLQNEKFFD
jgi:hypothetical protein